MKKKIYKYVEGWKKRCYEHDIPDAAPQEIFDKVPSYKRIAFAILKNDVALKSLGFTPPVSKYYTELKRIEIQNRKKNEKKKLKRTKPAKKRLERTKRK